MTDELETLVARVRKSRKYRHVSPSLIRHVGARELAIRPRLKEAVKATKRKLHQVGAAYWETAVDFDQVLQTLRSAHGDQAAFRAACRQVMARHSSTRERLPILEAFYGTTLAGLPHIGTVLDVACGLNPLAWPWMPFGHEVRYLACDVYVDMIDFMAQFMALAGIQGEAFVCDVVGAPEALPSQPLDLVLLLKSVPCLDQLHESAVSRLLDTINTRYWLISFPVQSLGGRGKGMMATYSDRFQALALGRHWTWQRFELETELAFLVEVVNDEVPGTLV
jgi:16S rRNA (guanine(1405)-N(7))-methyltransferase